jgi:hypothetical protein
VSEPAHPIRPTAHVELEDDLVVIRDLSAHGAVAALVVRQALEIGAAVLLHGTAKGTVDAVSAEVDRLLALLTEKSSRIEALSRIREQVSAAKGLRFEDLIGHASSPAPKNLRGSRRGCRMTSETHRDLADRVEDTVRTYVLKKMPSDPSGELAAKPFRELLHIYGNWRGRHPYARPRMVHRSAEMLASAEAQTFSSEIAELVRKMEAGEDLKPHRSRAVDTAFLSTQERAALPRSQRERDLDRMLADWGIHHLHLSGELEADGFVHRGNELLFAVFGRDHVYLVGIFTHRDWLHEDLVPVIVRNWPGVGPFRKLTYAQRATQTPTEQERARNRRQGISGGFVEVDGDWYGTLGQTAAGMPLPHTQPVMALGEELRQLRDDPEARLAQFAASLDAKAGRPVTGEWSPHVEDDIVGLLRGDDALVQLGVLPGDS